MGNWHEEYGRLLALRCFAFAKRELAAREIAEIDRQIEALWLERQDEGGKCLMN